MKPESIKFLHQIKERAGHIPDVMSLINSIFYEEGHASEILERTTTETCPSCGADWEQIRRDLSMMGYFQEEAHSKACAILAKCDECARHFGR